MAGFADPRTALAQRHIPAEATRDRTIRRSLPNGPCNFRDVASGQCGCDQFWDERSAEIHDESSEHRPSSARSTWCVCKHHACFHLRTPRGHRDPNASTGMSETARLTERSQTVANALSHPSHAGANPRLLQSGSFQAPAPSLIVQDQETPSQASTSGLPGIPSVCMISHDQRPATDNETRQDVNMSRHTVTGLGLSMIQLNSIDAVNRHQSPTPTIPDDTSVKRAVHQASCEAERRSSRAQSITTEPLHASSARGVLDQVIAFNRNLHLDVAGDTIPNTYNPEDFIQSATEIATPSLAGTPDLNDADRAVQEGKQLIDTLAQLTSKPEQNNGSPNRPATATSAPESQRWLTNASAGPQEQLQNVLRAASPQALQKMVSYLAPLHNLLNSIPNVANTMRDLGSRLDMLENGSFNYVQPEDLNQTLSMYDDRLIELEHRMDEHDKLHQAIDAEHASSSYNRRRIDNVATSFDSNQSLQSTTSSALILAAMDRKDTEMEISNIKDRLEMLEAAALPSTTNPWDVEVVLLPWGRHLRGIWFSPDEPMHDTSRTTTQESEEWTQAQTKHGSKFQSPHAKALGYERTTDSSPPPAASRDLRASVFSDTESGWSSQAISDWASGSAEDWLFPKACGNNNVVYKRLQSRGFVRNVTMKSASARDLQVILSNAFGDLLEHLSYTDRDGDAIIDTYPGLRASFIPLRKILKESKLRFLTPAEMSSSALWSAQFLASGVIMRVSGGRKRLYVTQRESYLQYTDDLGSSWTWQELRQLPRLQPDSDSQMEGNDEQCQNRVQEADAKEPCWQFVEAYDAPPISVHSSFESHESIQVTMRPAHRQWRRSITPSSILKHKITQPISPLSENHPRPNHLRNRTASASVVQTLPTASFKRRLNSSPVKQSSAPQSTSRAPSVSVARLKRRRTTQSTLSQHDGIAPPEAQTTIWNATPRRSRDPPSPFYSSLPALPRSNSDVTSRPSQRSIAVAGKSTPFAYATPHSGPIIGSRGFRDYDKGGDTEPDDDDLYDDDGEQSWRGVTDDENNDSSSSESSISDHEEAEPYGASFSGDDSGFGTDSGDDDEQSVAGAAQGTRHNATTDDDEEDGDVFDSLLDVLEH